MLIVGMISYFTIEIYKSTHPQSPPTINFQIMGISNASNTSTLAQMHYECIKWCANREYTRLCWEECEKLGKEGCT